MIDSSTSRLNLKPAIKLATPLNGILAYNRKGLTVKNSSIIRRRKPIQSFCSICNQEKKVQLANISGKYMRDIEDYMWLCSSCHALFDKINKTHIKEV